MFTHLILTRTLWDKNCSFSHFKDESPQTQGVYITHPRSHGYFLVEPRFVTRQYSSRVHIRTTVLHSRAEDSGRNLVERWPGNGMKEQEFQKLSFLLSTYYIPGIMDKKMSETVAHAPEKSTVWWGRQAISHIIWKQHGKFLIKYREAYTKGYRKTENEHFSQPRLVVSRKAS